ncbi:MAG: adenosine deaminase [Candidatus Korobacteraceae bacterium]
MKIRSRLLILALFFSAYLIAPAATNAASPAAKSDEARTERYFQSIRTNPNLLLAFLREMPKGGDLHNHLSGSVYAESYIQWAAQDGDCVDPKVLYFTAPPCTAPAVPVGTAFENTDLYGSIIDAISMRNWQYSGQSGHDHFFATFGRFSQATDATTDKALAETASRAASQHEIYQELMLTPTGKDLDALAESIGWDNDFGRLQQELLDGGLAQILSNASQQLNAAEVSRDKILHCGVPAADPGCQIRQRFLFQVARGKSKEVVFAEILSGFLLAGADPKLVIPNPHLLGLNLVMPEDWYVPIHDFPLHMRILNYFHERYPHVHIALHAGELVEKLVPPNDLQFHVRDSVEIGHAERIGHGVDVMNETRPFELLQEMADRNVMVEICLTSNDVILGVRGPRHPLSEYIRAGVPVALATDDEGVSRSDMTHEYLKGAEDQNLSYLQLKKMARTSLEYAFIGGASLWRDSKTFTVVVTECGNEKATAAQPSAACQRFLDGSEKARLQWKLEGEFRQFEANEWAVPKDRNLAAARGKTTSSAR